MLRRIGWCALLLLAVCAYLAAAPAEGELTYALDERGYAVITGCAEGAASITVPLEIDGHPVTGIGPGAFAQAADLKVIGIPGRVTEIADDAFGSMKPQIRALNGSEALRYARAHGLPLRNTSELDLFEDVVDLGDCEWSKDGGLLLPAWEAARLKVGSIFCLQGYTDDPSECAWQVTGVTEREGATLFAIEAAPPKSVLKSYRVEFADVPLFAAEEGSMKSGAKGASGNKPYTKEYVYGFPGNITMKIEIEYSASAEGNYDYDNGIVSDGYMLITETYKVTASVSGTADIDKVVSDFVRGEFASQLYTESEKGLGLYSGDKNLGFKIGGSVGLNLTVNGIGSGTYTETYTRGVRIVDGVPMEVSRRPVHKDYGPLIFAGSIDLCASGSYYLKLPVLGKVFSIDASAGVKLTVDPAEEQYDPLILCLDVRLRVYADFSISLKLSDSALSLGKTGFSIKKVNGMHDYSMPLMHFEYDVLNDLATLLDSGGGVVVSDSPGRHGEIRYLQTDNGTLLVVGVNLWMDHCSIREDDKCTIRFNTGSMEKIGALNCLKGQVVENPPEDPLPVSWRTVFKGWYTQQEGGELFDLTKAIPVDTPREMTLYAHWSEPYYTVDLDYACEDFAPLQHRLPLDSLVPAPHIPLRMNERFLGFFVADGDGNVIGSAWDFVSDRVPGDLKLVAQWEHDDSYDPFSVDAWLMALKADEELAKDNLNLFTFGVQLSTGVQAQLNFDGIGNDEAGLSSLHSIYVISGWREGQSGEPGGSTVPVIPDEYKHTYIKYIDGTDFNDCMSSLSIPCATLYVSGFDNKPNLQYVSFREPPAAGGDLTDEEMRNLVGTLDIEDGAFRDNPALTGVRLPSTLLVMGANAFKNTGLRSVSLPTHMRSIGSGAFEDCAQLRRVDYPYTGLPSYTFHNCVSLENFDPDGIRQFGAYSLSNTGLKDVSISNVEIMQNGVFSDCRNLESLSVSMAADVDFDNLTGYYPALKTLSIETSGEGKVNLSLSSAPELTEIIITGTVKYLQLSGLPKLQHVVINGNVVERDDYDTVSVSDCPLLDTFDVNGYWFGGVTFRNCGFTALDMRRTYVVRLRAPLNAKLETILLPPLATEIPASVYDSATRKQLGCFEGDTALERFDFNNFGAEGSGITSIGQRAFAGCTALKSVDFPDGVTNIGSNAYENCTALKSIELPAGLQQLGSGVFYGCTALKTACIPGMPEQMGKNLFLRCPNLAELTLGASVTDFDLANQVTGTAGYRLILQGDGEQLYSTSSPASNGSGQPMVLVASDASATRARYQASDDRRAVNCNPMEYFCILPYGSAEAEKRVVRFRINSGMLSKEDAYGPSANTMVFRLYAPGEKITPPACVSYMGVDYVFNGWYLDSAHTVPAPTVMPDEDIVLYGDAYDGSVLFSYELDGDGAVLTDYRGSAQYLTAPGRVGDLKVTGIADGCFHSDALIEITLPDTLIRVSKGAFEACPNLTAVHAQSDVLFDAGGALYDNGTDSGQRLIFVPRGKTGILTVAPGTRAIADGAAENCENLTGVVLNDGLEVIGENAFLCCFALSDIDIPGTVTGLGAGAFSRCPALRSVTFHADTQPGAGAIMPGEDLVIYGPQDAVKLSAWADEAGIPYNEYLLTLTDGEDTVRFRLRAGASLENYTPGDTDLAHFEGWSPDPDAEERVFTDVMPAQDTHLKAVWTVKYTVVGSTLTAISDAAGDDPVIPASVTAIASHVTARALYTVTIPAAVVSIADDAFGSVGKVIGVSGSAAEAWAQEHGIPFEALRFTVTYDTAGGAPIASLSLEAGAALELPEPQMTGAAFNGWLEDGRPFEETVMPARDLSLKACWLYDIQGPPGFRLIYRGDGTAVVTGYEGSSPEPAFPSVINGYTVTGIADSAFRGNRTLLSLTVPGTVTSVGANAFAHSGIGRVSFESDDIAFGEGVFSGCSALRSVALSGNLTALPEEAFADCASLSFLALPDSLTAIGENAFVGCTLIRSLTLPAGLTDFSADTLKGLLLSEIHVSADNPRYASDGTCVMRLSDHTLVYMVRNADDTEYAVDAGVTRIADRAMEGCRRIRTLTLPEGITHIGEGALRGIGVTELTLPATVKTLGAEVLADCDRLRTVYLSSGITSIGEHPFDDRSGFAIYVPTADCYAYRRLRDEYTVIVASEAIPVTGITLPESAELTVSEQLVLTCEIEPADATNTRVVWESDNEAVATVRDGAVTAVGEGAAYICAASPDGPSAVCRLTVAAAAKEGSLLIQLGWKNTTPVGDIYCLPDGKTLQINLQGFDNGTSFTVSEATGTLSISGTGDYRYVTFGSASKPESGDIFDLTVSIDGEAAPRTVRVMYVPELPEVNMPDYLTVFEGCDMQVLSGACRIPDSVIHRFPGLTVDDPEIASVDNNGFVHGLKAGVTALRYRAPGQTYLTMLTVAPQACDFTVNIPETFYTSLTLQLEPVCGAEGCSFTYESSNTDVATVTSAGLLKSSGYYTGTTLITVRAVRDGVTLAVATRRMEVIKAYSSFYFSYVMTPDYENDIYRLDIHGPVNLAAGGYPRDGSPLSVTWESSDPSVVSVDRYGIATPHACGEVTLTATLANGTVRTAQVVADHWDHYICLPSELALFMQDTQAPDIMIIPADEHVRLVYEVPEDYESIVTTDADGNLVPLKSGYFQVYVSLRNQSPYAFGTQTAVGHVYDRPEVQALTGLPESFELTGPGDYIDCSLYQYAVPANSTMARVTAALDDESIASVDCNGYYCDITAKKPGSTVLRLTLYNGAEYAMPVHVGKPDPYAVIRGAKDTLRVGSSMQFEAEVECTHAFTVDWTTDSSFLSVGKNGLVTAVACSENSYENTASIYARVTDTTTGKSFTASCQVALKKRNPNVTLPCHAYGTLSSVSMKVLEIDKDARADIQSVGPRNCYWYVSSSQSGDTRTYTLEVSPYDYGLFEILIWADNGEESQEAEVLDVYRAESGTPGAEINDMCAAPGLRRKLCLDSLTLAADSALDIAWSSDDPAVAKISGDGMLETLAAGTCTLSVRVTLEDGTVLADTATLTVTDADASAFFDTDEIRLKTGSGTRIGWSVADEDLMYVLSSDDPSVARVDQTGYVAAVSPGCTDIWLSFGSKTAAVCRVKVYDAIYIGDCEDMLLSIGESRMLRFDISPADADWTLISYSSDNPDIATVSSDGTVTAVGEGRATIWCETDGNSNCCYVYVYKAESGYTAKQADVTLLRGQTRTLTVLDVNGRAAEASLFSWSSSDKSVVTVAAGRVTGVGAGTAQVVARAAGGVRVVFTVRCREGEWLELPAALNSVGDEAFAGNTAIAAVLMHEGIRSVGSRAFAGCGNLTEATIENGGARVADDAFSGVSAHFTLHCPEGSQLWAQAEANGWNPAPLD